MKNLAGIEVTFDADFCGRKVKVRKLPMNKVKEFEAFIKEQSSPKSKKLSEEEKGNALMLYVFQLAVVGAEDLTLEDLTTYPVLELNELFKTIMKSIGVDIDKLDKQQGN